MRLLIVLIFFFCRSSAVIYQLNDTEYVRMPPIFHMDPYELCIHQTGGLYCMVEVDLVTDDSNELMDIIQEYSELKETHFNHTRLHHGICVTKTCNKYYIQNTTTDLKLVIEGCLNNSFWKEYNLKTKINEDLTCNDQDPKDLEPLDIAVAVICLSLILLNVAGTIYDILILKNKSDEGNKLLLCFSAKRNWLKLTASSTHDQEERINRLKGFNGIRTLTISLVIMTHSLQPFVVASDNTHINEQIYNSILYHLMLDGTILVQLFFVTSGCLLAYHLQIFSEKKDISWKIIPKAILLRWLRLTPPYSILLAVTATWLRFAGSGPLWHSIVTIEVDFCRRRGWLNLIYLNNYVDSTFCMPHTWYLAADMQLYILGIFILVLAKSDRARKIVLSLMLAIGIVLPALHTYFQNLHAFFILTPEVTRGGFWKDPTFNNTYKRGHTNMVCYILGLSVGLLIYHLQKQQFDIGKYRKYRYFYWAFIPLLTGLILCSSLFYMNGVTPPLYAKAIYSSLLKFVAGILMIVLVLGMVFKLENIYRPIIEWHGWRSPVKVSYSAYLLHLLLIQLMTGTRTTLIHMVPPQAVLLLIGSVFISYMVAIPFWLIAEAPFAQLFKLMLTAANDEKKKSKSEIEVNSSRV